MALPRGSSGFLTRRRRKTAAYAGAMEGFRLVSSNNPAVISQARRSRRAASQEQEACRLRWISAMLSGAPAPRARAF